MRDPGVQAVPNPARGLIHPHGRIENGGFAWPTVFVGIAMGLIASGVVGPSRIEVPRWHLASVGAMFVGAGVWLAIRDARRRGRDQRTRSRREAPWRWDHPWGPAGDTDSNGIEAGRSALVAAMAAVFGSLFVAGAWGGAGPWFGLPALLAGGWVVWALARTASRLVQRSKYGRTRIAWDRFPLVPGTTVVLRWEADGAPSRLRHLRFGVRCIRGQSSRESRTTTGRRTWLEEVWRNDLVAQPVAGASGGTEARVTFQLPEDAPDTRLSTELKVHWQLEVHGEGPGVDLRTMYLLPVYRGGDPPP